MLATQAQTSLLRNQFKGAHDWLEGTMQGVTAEQAAWVPPGKPSPIGAQYSHIVTGEDYLITMVVRGQTPLMMSTWAGKTGISEPPPPGAWDTWGRGVKVDLNAVRAYATDVYAATDTYLASLGDEDLAREIDLTTIGLGKMPLGAFLSIMVGNVSNHCGEISCLKGLQGLKGYPM